MGDGRWSRGDTVVLRHPCEERLVRAYLATTGDVAPNVAGWPHIVLEDSDDLVALYLPEGTPLWRWNIEEGRFREPRITHGDSVRLHYPERPFEVTLFFDAGRGPGHPVVDYFPGEEGPFYGWKVDMTAPYVRTEAGFDTFDAVLDIVVTPDRRHRWRDEDEMEQVVAAGLYTEDEAADLREAGETVVEMVQRRLSPFDDSWLDWRPDPGLKLGRLPDRWHLLPVPEPYRAYSVSPRD